MFSYGEWKDSNRHRLETRSFALFEWFHDNLGFELSGPYAVVWTLKVNGDSMFGGSHGNGTCFENPTGRPRAWQLLAHRLGHSINKYSPTGMSIRDHDDRWFKEGYASYVEVIATAATSAAKDEGYWNTLYTRYRRDSNNHPDWAFTLADEPSVSGDAAEYLHYTKAPLITKMLDVWLQGRTGRGLQPFMKEAFFKYGGFQAPFPVKIELEAFSRIPLDDFWQTLIVDNGPVLPVWPEYYQNYVKSFNGVPAATVAGVPITGDYLFFLAASGHFARFGDIETFLVKEIENRRWLDALGLPVIPPELGAIAPNLLPEVRYDLARLEANWTKPDPTRVFPSKTGNEAPLSLEMNLEHPDGKVFATLLQDERDHEADIVRHGLSEVTLRAHDEINRAKKAHPILAFGEDDETALKLSWQLLPASATITLTRGGEDTHVREVLLDPDWTWSRAIFHPSQRPRGDGVITFQIEPGAGGSRWRAQRSYWQRGE